jgi:hypothetical protein
MGQGQETPAMLGCGRPLWKETPLADFQGVSLSTPDMKCTGTTPTRTTQSGLEVAYLPRTLSVEMVCLLFTSLPSVSLTSHSTEEHFAQIFASQHRLESKCHDLENLARQLDAKLDRVLNLLEPTPVVGPPQQYIQPQPHTFSPAFHHLDQPPSSFGQSFSQSHSSHPSAVPHPHHPPSTYVFQSQSPPSTYVQSPEGGRMMFSTRKPS